MTIDKISIILYVGLVLVFGSNDKRFVMVVLKLYLDNVFSFKSFDIDFVYPKKIVNSTIPNEHLKGRPYFRYKKVNILLGANASGKTTLGKSLMYIFNFINKKELNSLIAIVGNPREKARFAIDFVADNENLERLDCSITPSFIDGKLDIKEISLKHYISYIGKNDSYHKAVSNLKEVDSGKNYQEILSAIPAFGWLFTYPQLDERLSLVIENHYGKTILNVLNAVLKTLDSSIKEVEKSKELKNTYIIRKKDEDIIIQDGQIAATKNHLSSGTIEGIDISFFIAAIIESANGFYYCDERFSYVHSMIEKRLLGIMISHLKDNQQLFFTTHNLDLVSLNLPKHSYTILSKEKNGDECELRAISASSYLKKNTDSLRNAIENDVFSSLPDETALNELEEQYPEDFYE